MKLVRRPVLFTALYLHPILVALVFAPTLWWWGAPWASTSFKVSRTGSHAQRSGAGVNNAAMPASAQNGIERRCRVIESEYEYEDVAIACADGEKIQARYFSATAPACDSLADRVLPAHRGRARVSR
jgi:hypothetical protein